MIDRSVFGKGEVTLIDRRPEVFPSMITAENPAQAEAFRRYHEAYLDEYFYILRKIFHTWAFDMREFAIDFHGVSVERFVQSLVWLTYIQTIIYEMDIHTEQEGARAHRRSAMSLEAIGQRIVTFLAEHDLLDEQIRRCVLEVITYLRKERDDLHQKVEYTEEQIFETLDLKSADLEMLRRICLRVCGLETREEEMQVFKRIDTIRETFDDIRDYFEDLEIANFNTVIFLQKLGGDMRRGSQTLERFLDREMQNTRQLIDAFEPARREKFDVIFGRLVEERAYFLELLTKIPSS